MVRSFCILPAVFIVILPLKAQTEELLLGSVETEMDRASLITVIQVPDRPRVLPEELVKIQSSIPGLDEVVESGKGYVYATAQGKFLVKITEGEPALGEEVVLLQGKFLNGSVSIDEDTWRRMGYEDIRKGINKPPNVAALCVLGWMYAAGEEIEKSDYRAYILFQYASRFQPSADCAAEYGIRALSGDQNDNPPKWTSNTETGFQWVEYAAKRGSYLGMVFYAMSLQTLGDRRDAKKWFKKAIKIEPEKFKGHAQKVWDRVRRR